MFVCLYFHLYLKKHIPEERDSENRRLWNIAHPAGHHGHGIDVHRHTVLHEPGGAQTRRLQLQIGRVVGGLSVVRDVHISACFRGSGPHGCHVQDCRGSCARATQDLFSRAQ